MRRILILALALAGVSAAPLAAQDSNVTGRVTKLEKEMRAVQRKVFPGGSTQFSEPDIGAPAVAAPPIGSPASEPIADLTERVTSLESQLRELTGQSEQNAYKLKLLEEGQARLDGRLKALETAAAPPAPVESPAKPIGTIGPKPAEPAKPSTLTPARKAQLDAIKKPSTGDLADDSYTYGYRLWEAKFFPEAQVALKQTVDKYPKYARISRARNLLGRAYLDDGKPAAAAKEFVANYEADQGGDRAPDSLYFLGVALTRYGNLPGACKAFDEFGAVYGTTATAALKANVAKGRAEAKCK